MKEIQDLIEVVVSTKTGIQTLVATQKAKKKYPNINPVLVMELETWREIYPDRHVIRFFINWKLFSMGEGKVY